MTEGVATGGRGLRVAAAAEEAARGWTDLNVPTQSVTGRNWADNDALSRLVGQVY